MGAQGKRRVLVAALALVCVSSGTAMAANKLIVRNAANTADAFVVTDSGFVGINTVPSYALEVSGAPGGTARLIVGTVGTSNSGGGGTIYTHNNASNASPTAGNRLGFVLFGAKNGTSNITGGGLMAFADANWAAGTSHPIYFSFYTAPSGSITQHERMRLTSSGNTQIFGGIQMLKNSGSPVKLTCSSAVRGMMWYTQGATSVADSFEVCSKDASGNYAWRTLF